MTENELKALEQQISSLEEEVMAKKSELANLRKSMPRQEVKDYIFTSAGGDTKLSELFGKFNDLIVIHNMGKGCVYCTLWADEFNGIRHHLENRAGFALVSPDDPATQKSFSEPRGWKFKMLSGKGNAFTKDMGFVSEKGGYMPGVSTFIKDGSGKIYRVAHAYFGPGDDYCGLWHLLDLLAEGANGWEPKFKY
jgi:predicted dithiol-disulfide oxidoreductase (DUF899 family)